MKTLVGGVVGLLVGICVAFFSNPTLASVPSAPVNNGVAHLAQSALPNIHCRICLRYCSSGGDAASCYVDANGKCAEWGECFGSGI